MLAILALALAQSSAAPLPDEPAPVCQRELVVLGAGQDAGAPQIGNSDDTGPELWPASLAVIDRQAGTRYLFEATPAITRQLALLDAIEPPKAGLGLDGIFLTHAHMGHYLGLAYLGREAAGAKGVPVHAMPRMAHFLAGNGPWNQLIELGNIAVQPMADATFTVLSDDLGVLPFLVPHRDEYSETVGFLIMTPEKRALFVPDLDSWDEFAEMSGQELAQLLTGVDFAFIDATFFDDDELTGRDMSEIPHPRVARVMERLAGLEPESRAKVHFIHANHTNPVRDPDSAESRTVIESGFNIARRGDRHCLG